LPLKVRNSPPFTEFQAKTPSLNAHGSEQFFFGTDFPHPEFQRYHNTAAAILDQQGLSQDAKDNILGNNIARFLRLG